MKMARLESLKEIVDKYKQDLIEIQTATNELVFNSGDLNYMTAYDGFVRQVYKAAKGNRLSGQIGRSVDLLHEGKIEEKKNVEEYISYQKAINLWKQSDKTNGRELLTDSGYRFRIRSVINKKQVGAKKRNKRIRSVNKNDLCKLL